MYGSTEQKKDLYPMFGAVAFFIYFWVETKLISLQLHTYVLKMFLNDCKCCSVDECRLLELLPSRALNSRAYVSNCIVG